jgi:hypothetical protein
MMIKITALTNTWLAKASSRLITVSRDDRGDVPGWVLVTVMTAGLVVAIWSIADGQLKSVLQNAIRSVSAP